MPPLLSLDDRDDEFWGRRSPSKTLELPLPNASDQTVVFVRPHRVEYELHPAVTKFLIFATGFFMLALVGLVAVVFG